MAGAVSIRLEGVLKRCSGVRVGLAPSRRCKRIISDVGEDADYEVSSPKYDDRNQTYLAVGYDDEGSSLQEILIYGGVVGWYSREMQKSVLKISESRMGK